MPSRILREGILSSESVNSLSAEAELFYRRLMSVVDDFGRYYAHPALLRAACYPLQLFRVTEQTICTTLKEVSEAGLIKLYQVGGKEYLEYLNFRQRTRASKSRFPPPINVCQSNDVPNDGHTSHVVVYGDGDDIYVEQARPSKLISANGRPRISGLVSEVFEHWKAVMKHPRAVLDSKRQSAIAQRLRDGYTVEILKQAIDGCALSPHHMGQNDRNTIYDDIGLICRDAKHVEQFLSAARIKKKVAL